MRLSTIQLQAIKQQHMRSRVQSYTVSIRYRTSRICESMRLLVVYRSKTVVLQVSNSNISHMFYSFIPTFGFDFKQTFDLNKQPYITPYPSYYYWFCCNSL